MEIARGKFIAIEGTDGSGKGVQFNRLLLDLPDKIKFHDIDFPRYQTPAAYFVGEYLNGRYGHEVDARQASVLFAVDRFDAKQKLLYWLENGNAVIANRYVASNLAHQGAKIEEKGKRLAFFKWLYEFEYGILGVPKPDLNIVLHVPAEIAQTLIEKKGERAYLGGKAKDIHEADLAYQKRAEQVYLEIAELFPRDFTVIECAPGGTLLSIDEVHALVMKKANALLGI
ncbi:MAG TPA: thymidylate kinase [Candidatus Paceibacterota bacterium]|nr:thymidylate kinase [Candidatus Paceibacterota bacterium]